MNNKLLTLIITLVVGIILTGSILVPAIEDTKHSIASTAQNTTENYNAVYTTALESDVVVELDENNKLLVNNVEVNPALDMTETVVVTNQFVITYSGTALTFLGLSGGTLSKITMHPDGSYDVVKADSTTASGTGVEVIIYPDNNGKYGAFVQGAGHEDFWLDNGATAYISFLSGGITDDASVDHYVNTLYSATNSNFEGEWNTIYSLEDPSGSWVDLPSKLKLNEPYTKEVGEYAVHWGTNGFTATFTNDSGDFDATVGSPIVYAPLEYHYLAEKDDAVYSLIGVIPVMVVIALLMVAIGGIYVRRND